MSIMSQLEFEIDFSDSEIQIARYILSHGDEVLNISSRELANKTYTSPATIVRLCRKLGLKGYSDFKIKYSAELNGLHLNTDTVDVNFPFREDDSLETIVYSLATLQSEVTKNTIELIDFDLLKRVIDLFDEYSIIDFYGNGNSLLVAMGFEHKMMRIGKTINLKTLHGEQSFFAYNTNKNHLSVIISYSGETGDLIRSAQVIKERNSTLILITSVGDNQLSHYADYILNVDSKEKIFSKIAPFASQISMEYLLNIIYSGIFQKHYNKYLETKIAFDKRFDGRHPNKSPVTEK